MGCTGSLSARGGWFDLAQGESFVFRQPPQPNSPIAFTEPLPDSIGDPTPVLPVFQNRTAPTYQRGPSLAFQR